MTTTTTRAIFIPLQATSPRKCSTLHFRGANLSHSLHFSFSLWIRQGGFCIWWCFRYNHSMSSFGVQGSCYLKTLRKLILIFSSRSTAWREGESLLTDLYNLGVGVTHESNRARHLTRAPATRRASSGSANTAEGTCTDWFPESEKHLKGGHTVDRPQIISRCLYQMEEGLVGVEAGLENAVQEGLPLQGRKDLPSAEFHGEPRMKTLS